jgi:ornithine cyclodeaminase
MLFLDSDYVRRHLTYPACIAAVREAMIAFSAGETQQLLRSILHLGEGRMLGVMPGGMEGKKIFGAKLVSVFPENFGIGKPSHQGVIVLFESGNGAPVCIVDGSTVTSIRTAAASAAASDALARPEAMSLALLGYGEQAYAHAIALNEVRNIETIHVWGRSPLRAEALAERLHKRLGVRASAAPTAEEAVANADIICTLTAAAEPILNGAWVKPGAHVNVVGSGHAGPAEIDNDLVRLSRFIADSRASVLEQGAEFLRAKAQGLVGDSHIAAEIGEVFAGKAEGRRSPEEITVYKSLGHVAQDLAAAALLYEGYGRKP